MHGLTNETIDHLRTMGDTLVKAGFTQPAVGTDGLQFHNLEPVVKHLYPVLTPMRNRLARNSKGAGTAVRWKAITGINTANVSPGVSEGNRNAAITHTTADYLAAYKGLGLEDYVTFEAGYASRGLIDVDAEARMATLSSLLMQEEIVLIGGQGSADLTKPGAPTGVASAAGGALSASTTYYCAAVALTLDGYKRTTVAAGCPGEISRTNQDGSSDTFGGGNTDLGTEGSQATGGSDDTITWTVTDIPGACGYAWFTGTSTGAANLNIHAVTETNQFVMSTVPPGAGQAGNAAAVATNYSQNDLVHDGMIYYIADSGDVYSNDGAVFTVDASGSVDEIDQALKPLWNDHKVAGDWIYLNGNTAVDLSKKVLGTATNKPNISINVTPDQKLISIGEMVGTYRNKWAGGKDLKFVIVHDMVDGQMIISTDSLPYERARVPRVWEVEQRQPYYSITWPLKSRKREYGVYVDQVLKCYAPFACAFVKNIKLEV